MRYGSTLAQAALAVLLAAVLGAGAAAAQTLIDDFSDAQALLDAPPDDESFVDEAASGIIPDGAMNGERDLELSRLYGSGGGTVAQVSGGNLEFAVQPGDRGRLLVTWDGNDGDAALDPTGLGGVDLSSNNTFRLQVGPTTGLIELVMEVFTDGSDSSRSVTTVSAPGDVYFPFNQFSVRQGSGADFANVGAITLEIVATGGPGVNGIAVSRVEAAPPGVTATKVDALAPGGDADMDGKADPGDVLRYTVQVTATGDTTGVTLQDDLPDPNLTFQMGSIRTTPLALDDVYDCLGHVGITVPAGAGVLANDTDPDGSGLATPPIASVDDSLTKGTVLVNPADGSFTYDPARGFTGVDSFTYTIADGEGGMDTAKVVIHVERKIWFIDSNGAGTNMGTLTNPFKTLGAFEAANGGGGAMDPAAGDCIFVYTGTGAYTGGVTLEDQQILVGQGAGSALATLCGVTLPPHSNPLPSTGGSHPLITNAAGNGITLGMNDVIHGIHVDNTTGAGIFGNFGTLFVRDTFIDGTGNILDLSNGTLDAEFGLLATTAASTAINLNAVGGSLDVATGTGIVGATVLGINVQNAAPMASFSFGDTGVAGKAGVNLMSNGTATTTFKMLGVGTSMGAGLTANIGGTVNIGASSAIVASGGPALNVTSTTLNNDTGGGGTGGVTFAMLSSTSATGGINLDTVAGFVIGTAGTITNTGGTAVRVHAGTGNVTLGTAISNSGGRAVEVTSRTTGAVTFQTGAITDTGGTGIRVASNSGGTVSFNGNVDVINSTGASVTVENNTSAVTSFANLDINNSTSNKIGIFATNNGTYNENGTANDLTDDAITNGATLNVTTGTVATGSAGAVDIDTTILGVNLVSVTSNVAGASPGIDLNSTTGIFRVSGDGTTTRNSSGGTIANKTGTGVVANRVSSLSLNHMTVNANGTHGFDLDRVSGFALRHSTVNDNGDSTDEHGIDANELFELVKIENTGFARNSVDQVRIENMAGTMALFSVLGSHFEDTAGSAAPGNNGINFAIRGTGQVGSALVGLNRFNNLRATGIQVDVDGTGTIADFTILGCDFDDNNAAINMTQAAAGNMLFHLLNNGTVADPIDNDAINPPTVAINVFAASGTTGGSLAGTVSGNFVDVENQNANGIRVILQGQTVGTIGVSGNTIDHIGARGLEVFSRDGTGGLDITISGNTVTNPTGSALAGIFVSAIESSGAPNSICANITGNTAAGGTFFFGFGGDFLLQKQSTSTFQLEGTAANAVTQVGNTNTATNGAINETDQMGNAATAISIVAAGTCAIPPP